MSLVKRPVLTPRKIEANRANARLSEGPASTEGIERIRDAQVRHGFYSKSNGEALRALGEKPDDFERLAASLAETWQPESDYELVLVRRLARALWRVERADRVQEAMTVYQVERVARHVEGQAEDEAVRHKERMAALERALEASQRLDGRLGDLELEGLESAFGTRPEGRLRQILYRVCRLLPPPDRPGGGSGTGGGTVGGRPADAPSGGPKGSAADSLEPWDMGPPAGPELPDPPSAAERDRLRSELRSLLRQEMEAQQMAYRRQRERRERELSAAALDSAMASDHPRADYMLRTEAAAFRQVKQLTQMLMQFRQLRQRKPIAPAASESDSPDHRGPEDRIEGWPEIKNDGKSHDVVDNKGQAQNDFGKSHDVIENT